MVTLRAKKFFRVTFMPVSNSVSKKVFTKLAINTRSPYCHNDKGEIIHKPSAITATIVTGISIFQPKRMIWS